MGATVHEAFKSKTRGGHASAAQELYSGKQPGTRQTGTIDCRSHDI